MKTFFPAQTVVSVSSDHSGNRGGVVPVNTATSVKASISTMHHFNEFVKAFCDFGSDMVHLIRITAGMIHIKKLILLSKNF